MPRTATITLDTSQLTERARSATVTIRFDQPTPGLGLANLTADNATLTDLRSADGGLTWTATLTVSGYVEDASNHVTLRYPDLVDAQGQSVASVSSASYGIDNIAPWLISATINGNRLVLGYREGMSLDALHKPAAEAFYVVNGGSNPVTAVSVDAAANTVTLTLTYTVTREQVVTVSYMDPTLRSDDAYAVQDAAGNDAADVSDRPVTNLSAPDTQGPTLETDGITLNLGPQQAITWGHTPTVGFIFSEPVLGFDAGDVNLPAGCQLRGLKQVSSTFWQAQLIVADDIELASATISVNMAGVTDKNGNAGSGSSAPSARFTIDTACPTMQIVVGQSRQTATGQGSRLVTITLSEAANRALKCGEFLAQNATLSELTSTDGITWTGTLTPRADTEWAKNQIQYSYSSYNDLTDVAGNIFLSAYSNNYVVDTVAPTLLGASIAGSNGLKIFYSDGVEMMAAGNAPAASAFTVLVNGDANPVTGVSVKDGTIMLTLARAVSADQQVRLSYRDPTPGNDINAIQDAAGNDAASFSNHLVSNPVSLDDEIEPARDNDSDRVPDAVENQATGLPGPGGAAAITGDGNGDGLADSRQPQVGSIRLSASPGDTSNGAGAAQTTWATLVTASQDGKVSANPGDERILGLAQGQEPASLPQALKAPVALLSFVAGTRSFFVGGASGSFSLYLDPALNINGYWVLDSSGVWVNLASSPYGGKTVLEGARLRLDFSITDGGRFDSDGKADGHIHAVGAPAHMALSIVGLAPDAGQQTGFWF